MSQFLPADHAKGDANTVGGYAAVHARPPAFEGRDGASYSVEIMTDATGERERPFAGYLLFVRWATGDPVAAGHVETDYLCYAETEAEVREQIGGMQLNDARGQLDSVVAGRAASGRPWWEAMRDETAQ